uniref:Uncharacterized protein n=1 Tax=Timema monikensis TaxID=170555 RepID=A0A7R9E4T8_9NEOP|nr:unnamed protein product [Timema monikensis]
MIVFLFIAVCLVALSRGYPRKHPHHQGKARHLDLETYDEYYPGQEEDEIPNTAVVASMAKSRGPSNAKGLGSMPWIWSYRPLKQCPQGYKRDVHGIKGAHSGDQVSFRSQEVCPHLRGGRLEYHFGKTTLNTSDRDLNLVIGILAQHETSALVNYATEVGE